MKLYELVGGRKVVALGAGLLLALVVLLFLIFSPRTIPEAQLKLLFDFVLGLIGLYMGSNAISGGVAAVASAIASPKISSSNSSTVSIGATSSTPPPPGEV